MSCKVDGTKTLSGVTQRDACIYEILGLGKFPLHPSHGSSLVTSSAERYTMRIHHQSWTTPLSRFLEAISYRSLLGLARTLVRAKVA